MTDEHARQMSGIKKGGAMMKTWRERIAEAERRRGRSIFWRFMPWPFTPWCWPFTPEDNELWLKAKTCPAAEVADRYGLEWWRTGELFDIGMHFGRAMMRNDVKRARRLLDAIEDRALELKRAQPG